MKVKCVDDSKYISLIKGKIYTVDKIIIYSRDRANISLVGLVNRINLEHNCLVNLDGSNIEKKGYINPMFKDEIIHEGDLVRYIKNSSKRLRYGKIYTVRCSYYRKISLEEVFTISKKGTKTYPDFSIFSFDKVSEDEIRDIKLNQILEDVDDRVSNYDKPHIESFEKLTILLDEIKRARQYLKNTYIKDTSIMEVIERRNRDKKLVSPKDFEMLEDINWNELLYKK